MNADFVHQHTGRCFGGQVVGNQEGLAGLRVEETLDGAVGAALDVKALGIYNRNAAIASGVERQGFRNSVNIARGGILANALECQGLAACAHFFHIEHSAVRHLLHVTN